MEFKLGDRVSVINKYGSGIVLAINPDTKEALIADDSFVEDGGSVIKSVHKLKDLIRTNRLNF